MRSEQSQKALSPARIHFSILVAFTGFCCKRVTDAFEDSIILVVAIGQKTDFANYGRQLSEMSRIHHSMQGLPVAIAVARRSCCLGHDAAALQ